MLSDRKINWHSCRHAGLFYDFERELRMQGPRGVVLGCNPADRECLPLKIRGGEAGCKIPREERKRPFRGSVSPIGPFFTCSLAIEV